jgi:nicotinamide riboside kinase
MTSLTEEQQRLLREFDILIKVIMADALLGDATLAESKRALEIVQKLQKTPFSEDELRSFRNIEASIKFSIEMMEFAEKFIKPFVTRGRK